MAPHTAQMGRYCTADNFVERGSKINVEVAGQVQVGLQLRVVVVRRVRPGDGPAGHVLTHRHRVGDVGERIEHVDLTCSGGRVGRWCRRTGGWVAVVVMRAGEGS